MVQLKEKDFDFTKMLFASEPAQVLDWVPVVPSTASAEYKLGWMHNGYFGSTSIGGFGSNIVACTHDNPDADELTKARAFVNRRAFDKDCLVAFTAHLAQFSVWGSVGQSVAGSGGWVFQHEWGALCRVVAGTLTADGTYNVRYENLTCYFFRVRTEAPNTVRFTLGRFQAGVEQIIAHHTLPGVASMIKWNSPTVVQLQVTTPATHPEIKCTWGPFSIQPGVPFPATQIFSTALPGTITNVAGLPLDAAGTFTDNDLTNQILAAGGCHAGFTMGRDRTDTGVVPATKVADAARAFQVNDLSSGSVPKLIEEWDQLQHDNGRVLTDGLGVNGSMVHSLFWHDRFAAVDPDFDLDSATQRGELAGLAGGSRTRMLMYQRKEDDDHNQRRSCKLTLTTTGGVAPSVRRQGIVLRGNPIGTEDVRAYIAYVVRNDDGSFFKIVVSRWQSSSGGGESGIPMVNEEIIADADASGIVVLDTPFVMEFQVQTHPESADPDGPVQLFVVIDSTQVVLQELSPAVTGVTVNAAGTVTDSGVSRIQNGFGAGAFIAVDGFYQDHHFDDWTALAISPPEDPPGDFATISVSGEGTGTTDISTIIPLSWPVETRYLYRGSAVKFESGHVQTWPRTTKLRRIFRVQVDAAVESEAVALRNFFDTLEGPEKAFLHTPVGGTQISVALLSDTLVIRRRGPADPPVAGHGTYSVRFEFVELPIP